MKIHIPNPCLENYDNMSSTDLGKMCTICNTEVIDFTNWETKDIINYIQNSNKKVCGKLIKKGKTNKIEFSWNSYIKLAGAVLLLNTWSTYALADTNLNNLSINKTWLENSKTQLQSDSVTLQFLTPQNNIFPEVMLENLDTKEIFHSDSKGIIRIAVPTNETHIFEARLIGYEPKVIKLNYIHQGQTLEIKMEQQSYEIGEVIVEPISGIKRIFNGPKSIKGKPRN